jgi:phenylalanyl-tRNA synthetase beta chain
LRVSYRWLQDYVKCELPAEELAEELTMVGLEVEGVFPPVEGLDRIIVGKILEIKPHPNAENLMLCRVDTGSDIIQLVSGAPNLKTGVCAALALPGVILPGGMVEVREFRGERSEGMLCSGAELGTDQWGYGDDKGVLLLDGEIPPGTKLEQAIKLDDKIIEIELTPNRGDCQAVINIAREVKAITGAELQLSEPVVIEEDGLVEDYIKVRIEAPDLCRRFACRVVRNIKLEPSPSWMQQRLLSAGMRPINNIVDVTNYVMLEFGQPLHAYDLDKIQGAHINVRRGRSGEKMVSLDGMTRELDPEMLVIADEEEAVGLAGVMGGLASEVTEKTHTILLESAWFEPLSVRRTASRLGLHSEASRRFEKGINGDGIIPALNRAAQLIQQLGAGQVIAGIVDVNIRPEAARTIRLRTARVNKVLGTKLAREEIKELLKRLDFPCELISGDAIFYKCLITELNIFDIDSPDLEFQNNSPPDDFSKRCTGDGSCCILPSALLIFEPYPCKLRTRLCCMLPSALFIFECRFQKNEVNHLIAFTVYLIHLSAVHMCVVFINALFCDLCLHEINLLLLFPNNNRAVRGKQHP